MKLGESLGKKKIKATRISIFESTEIFYQNEKQLWDPITYDRGIRVSGILIQAENRGIKQVSVLLKISFEESGKD